MTAGNVADNVAIATIERPKAIAIPNVPRTEPAIAALPHPKRTKTAVPINSAIYFLMESIKYSLLI